jgi:hypothetical protein
VLNDISRLQDETARVEDELMKPSSLDALLGCFVSAKANSFENLLDPFLKITRLSTNITIGIAKAQFFNRIIDRLSHSKAVVRLNLLRILRTVCEVHPNKAILVERYGLFEIVDKLSKEDGAVLVRELARDISPTLMPALRPTNKSTGGLLLKSETPRSGSIAPKRMRRTASEASAVTLSQVPFGGAPTTSSKLGGGAGKPRPLSATARQKLGDIPWIGSSSGSRR